MRSPSLQATQRTHIDDLALPLPQKLERFARNQKWSTSVRGEGRIPLLDRQFLKIHGFVVRGIVNQDVQPTQFAGNFLHRAAHTLFIRDVASQRHCSHAKTAQINHRRLSFAGRITERNRYVSASTGQFQRNRPP